MTNPMPTALPDPEYDRAFYEGVPIKRLFAWGIDVILLVTIVLILGILTFSLVLWFFVPVYVIVSFLYRTLTISSRSATFGMRIMAIELRNSMGSRLSGGEAVIHTLTYLVCAGFVILQLISVGLVMMSSRHQNIPDHLLGTAMINRPN